MRPAVARLDLTPHIVGGGDPQIVGMGGGGYLRPVQGLVFSDDICNTLRSAPAAANAVQGLAAKAAWELCIRDPIQVPQQVPRRCLTVQGIRLNPNQSAPLFQNWIDSQHY